MNDKKDYTSWYRFLALFFTSLLILWSALQVSKVDMIRIETINECNDHWRQNIEMVCPELVKPLYNFDNGSSAFHLGSNISKVEVSVD